MFVPIYVYLVIVCWQIQLRTGQNVTCTCYYEVTHHKRKVCWGILHPCDTHEHRMTWFFVKEGMRWTWHTGSCCFVEAWTEAFVGRDKWACLCVETLDERINHHLPSRFSRASMLQCPRHIATTWTLTTAYRKVRTCQTTVVYPVKLQHSKQNSQRRPTAQHDMQCV